MLSFNVTEREAELIDDIADRAWRINAAQRPRKNQRAKLDYVMDISATHANGCPLDLPRLLQADDFNFMHDVFGIERHLNRTTGALEDCFLPRFAKKETVHG